MALEIIANAGFPAVADKRRTDLFPTTPSSYVGKESWISYPYLVDVQITPSKVKKGKDESEIITFESDRGKVGLKGLDVSAIRGTWLLDQLLRGGRVL